MPDLEDAEAAIAEQERWGLTITGIALKRLVAAVRLIRARGVAHENRLNAVEARVTALENPPAPAAPPPPT